MGRWNSQRHRHSGESQGEGSCGRSWGTRPTCPSGSPACPRPPLLQLCSPHAALSPTGRRAGLEGARQAPRKPF